MQSVVLWLSGEDRNAASFPFITLALCYFVAWLPAVFLNTIDPFARFLKKRIKKRPVS